MLVISYVQVSDKECWLSVVSKKVTNNAGYQLCPRE